MVVIRKIHNKFSSLKSFIYYHDVVYLYKHTTNKVLSCPVSIKDVSFENVMDADSFQNEAYIKTFKKFLKKDIKGIYAYFDNKCCHRSWIFKNEMTIDSLVTEKLSSNQIYIGWCETASWARGKGIYPYVLNYIAKQYSKYEIFITANKNNISSQHGIEKAGFQLFRIYNIKRIMGIKIIKTNEILGVDRMNNREQYIDFYKMHNDICIYSSPWWLDTLVGEKNRDVILIKDKNNNIIASFPYVIFRGKFGFMQFSMPPLTQKLGPYIVYDPNKNSEMKKIGYEHEIYNQIIEKLPKFDLLNINFDQKYKNWLPFYWRGFNQTTRYSYKIDNLKDFESIYNSYAKSKKQKIQKAMNLTLKFDLDFNDFYDYFEESVKERGDKVSYTRDLFIDLCKAVYSHNAGRIFYCVDNDNNIHAINLTVWDNESAYYLIAMRKSKFKTSGGTEFLVNETIKYVANFVNVFDFEGSMIKGVEESFRFYGAKQTEYYNISKNNTLVRPILSDLKKLFAKILRGGEQQYSIKLTHPFNNLFRAQEASYANCA